MAHKDGVNVTMAAIQEAREILSLQHMSMCGCFAPCIMLKALYLLACRMLNVAATDPIDGWTLHYLCGKGDWKHKRDWLQERRSWSASSAQSNGVCRRCLAKDDWANIHDCDAWYPGGETALPTAFGPIACLSCSFAPMMLFDVVTFNLDNGNPESSKACLGLFLL